MKFFSVYIKKGQYEIFDLPEPGTTRFTGRS